MGRVLRSLLVRGNGKLSQTVFHFSLPAATTCPGKSKLCHSRCYALKNRFQYPQVQERLEWNYQKAKRRDFVDRLVDELYRKGILAMRWHVSGDIFSPGYARKILEIVGRSSHTTHWLYFRSWRTKTIFPILKAISLVPNMHAWFSCDAETGYPPEVPQDVRIAWMQIEADENPEDADLVFLDHPLRNGRISLPQIAKVCPVETQLGKARGTTCATCRICWT